MNNDLISRAALKTALANNTLIRDFNLQFDGIIGEIIDNAPTVEQHYVSDLPDDVIKTLQTLAIDYSDGIAIFERKRPQGKWIEINERIGIGEDNIYTSFKCPFCGYIDLHDNNYCVKCGADMRKGGADMGGKDNDVS